MSEHPLILTDDEGAVRSILVASWEDSEDLLGATLHRDNFRTEEGTFVLDYQNSVGTFSVSFEVRDQVPPYLALHDVLGESPHAGRESPHAVRVMRRIRWAVRAAGLLRAIPYPMWSEIRKDDPHVLVSNLSGLDPELQPLVEAADRALHALRTRSGDVPDEDAPAGEGLLDEDEKTRLVDAFCDPVQALLDRTRIRRMVLDDGEEAPGEVVRLDLSYHSSGEKGESGHVCRLGVGPPWNEEGSQRGKRTWYQGSFHSFAHLWRNVLWGGPKERSVPMGRRPFVLVVRSELEAWLASGLEPGKLSVDEEEVQLFRMLGEPSPLARPWPELLRWALERG